MFVPGLMTTLGILGRRPNFAVALPVSTEVWRRWRRRAIAGQAAVTFGLVLTVFSVIGRQLPPGVLGGLVLIGGISLWARAHQNWWVTCRYDPTAATVVVEPAHSRFDDQARLLFTRTIR
jgi:hypothetical protein